MRIRLAALALLVSAWAIPLPAQQISEPLRGFGASITAAYEGWFNNADGTHSFLIGYYNRNNTQTVDIPIGVNNRMEPNGPDLGQPTHFLPGRQTGVFTVVMPKEFPATQRFNWAITVNNQTTNIPFWMNPLYEVSPFTDVAVGNKPPVIKFDVTGATIQGPIALTARAIARTATMAAGLALPVWASDDAKYSSGSNAPQRNPPPAVILHWTKYRGPGEVTFDQASPVFEKMDGPAVFNGKATTTAKFSAPGDYILHVDAEDYSGKGGGGEVCCFTTGMVRVTVTP